MRYFTDFCSLNMNKDSKHSVKWNLETSYLALPYTFYAKQLPEHAPYPDLVRMNTDLAAELGLDFNGVDAEFLLSWLAGNELPPGSIPFAQAYAGLRWSGKIRQKIIMF